MTSTYAPIIAVLGAEPKRAFYRTLAHELTVALRAVWANQHLSPAAQVDQMKWLNEIMHRVLNRLADLDSEPHIWGEEEVWSLIRDHVAQNRAIAGLVGRAIATAYTRATGHDLPPCSP